MSSVEVISYGFVETLQDYYHAPAMKTTRVIQHIKGRREMVYRALIDPNAIEIWKVPNDMTSEVPTPITDASST